MNREAILAVAVALQEFRVRQLAAYCGASPEQVEAALATVPGLVEPTGPDRWRVVEPGAIRTAVGGAKPLESLHRTREPADSAVGRAGLIDRLVVAEETLIGCGAERSPALRQVMAATARNNVLQVLAQLTPEQGPWWGLEEQGPSWRAESFTARIDVAGETAQPEIDLSRLRADFDLASLTGREAAGEPVTSDDLVRTAVRLRDVLKIVADRRLDRLFHRFIELTIDLTGPAGLGEPGGSARVRLLVALAWRHLHVAAAKDVRQASERMLTILQHLEEERDKLAGRTAIDLYRFIEHLPDGLNRLVVYRDLLELLPTQMVCHRQKELLPDVLVEAFADSAASEHLERIATRLKDGLDHLPSSNPSERALIGTAAHVFNDVAQTSAHTDASLIQRSDQMRMQLVRLAEAQVRA